MLNAKNKKILLAIDIGNTNISFGIFKDNQLTERFNIPTKIYNFKKLKNKLSRLNSSTGSIICSVVPSVTKIIKEDIKIISNTKSIIVGKDIKIPMRNLYRNPGHLGQDRFVNAYAGSILYGYPCIVIDCGTAITFDIVSKDNEYLGGMILPGPDISIKALKENTALLPTLKLEKPKEFIGKDTKSGILSGVVYGFATLIDGMVKKIKKHLGYEIIVIGTGGAGSLLYTYSKTINKIDKDLTLKGLYLLYQKYCSSLKQS